MRKVSDFFSRFARLAPPHATIKKAVAEAVTTILKKEVRSEDVSLGRGIAFIKGSSIMKSALHVERARILERLFDLHPEARERVRDVR